MRKLILTVFLVLLAEFAYSQNPFGVIQGGGTTLTTGSVTSAHIADNAIKNVDVANDAGIEGSKLADNVVLTDKQLNWTVARGSFVINATNAGGLKYNAYDSVGNLTGQLGTYVKADNTGETWMEAWNGSTLYGYISINDNADFLDNYGIRFRTGADVDNPVGAVFFNSGSVRIKSGTPFYADNVAITGGSISGVTGVMANLGGEDPTLTTIGEIAVDSTNSQLLYYDNAVHVLVPDYSKGVTILSPVAGDNSTMLYTKRAITITQLDSVITGTDNVTWFIQHATSRADASPDNVVTGGTTTTSSTTGTIVASFDDATIPANRWIWLQCSAIGGTPTSIHITMHYAIDRE